MALVGAICCCDSAGQCDLSPGWCGVYTSTLRKTKTSKSHFQHLKLYLQPFWTDGSVWTQRVKSATNIWDGSLLAPWVCRDMSMPDPPGHSLGWMDGWRSLFPQWQAGARPHPSLSSCFANKQVDLHLLAVLQSVSVVAAVAWGSQGDVLGVSMVSLALSCREGRAACAETGSLLTLRKGSPRDCVSNSCRGEMPVRVLQNPLGASAHPSIPQASDVSQGLALVCQIEITASTTRFFQYHYIHQTGRIAASFKDFFCICYRQCSMNFQTSPVRMWDLFQLLLFSCY